LEQFHQLGIDLFAVSVDSQEDARAVKQEEEIDFPIIYGMDCVPEAEKIGAYYDKEKQFFHATNFLLRDGRIVQSTYSSGPIGRMQAEHVAGVVKFYQSQEADSS